MIVLIVLLLIISIIIFLWQASNIISIISGSLYVKADINVIRKSLELVRLKKGQIFYDLGSGNGDVLIEASKYDVKAVGYEISPYYYLLSKIRTFRNRNIEVRFQNIKDVDLKKADVVYVYLLPKFLDELASKFKRELKPSAELISIGFSINNLLLIKEEKIGEHRIYIYK